MHLLFSCAKQTQATLPSRKWPYFYKDFFKEFVKKHISFSCLFILLNTIFCRQNKMMLKTWKMFSQFPWIQTNITWISVLAHFCLSPGKMIFSLFEFIFLKNKQSHMYKSHISYQYITLHLHQIFHPFTKKVQSWVSFLLGRPV